MIATVRRAALAGIVGASAAALTLVGGYALHPGLSFEMDRPLPSFISGMHGSERDGVGGTFAWTSARVDIDIPGIDRQVAWSCTVRFRGARGDAQPQPALTVDVDGARAYALTTTNDYQELGIALPPALTSHASIVLTIDPPFTPLGADRRVLGIQLDSFK